MGSVIINGKQARRQAKSIAEILGLPLIDVLEKVFPDGENYLRIIQYDKINGNKVFIVNTMYPRQNDSFLETLMLIDASKRAGASEISLILLYLAYARQDKLFLPGEPITGDIVIKSITRDIDKLYVVDIHSAGLLENISVENTNILVSDLLVSKILEYVDNPIILAPDKGALERARYAAEKHGLEYDHLVKHRDRVTGEVYMEPKELNVKNRDVVIVDDIISTGGTIALAAKNALKLGARKVFVAATHALLVGNALDKIKNSGVAKIVTADTLGLMHKDPIVEYIDISSRISAVIKDQV